MGWLSFHLAVQGPRRIGRCASQRQRGRRLRPGFTLVELLVTVGIIAILAGLVLAIAARARTSARGVTCISNLRQIGQAFTLYASSNDMKFPAPLAAGKLWEQMLSEQLPNRESFRCPSDQEVFPAVRSSYDWRDTGDPLTTLAGRDPTDSKRMNAVLAFEALPSWHAEGRMNAVLLDGAAVTLDERDCLRDLLLPIRGPGPMPPRPDPGQGKNP